MGRYKSPRPGSKWYVPADIYRTVVNFCLCYPRWKRAAAATGISSPVSDGMPRKPGPSDPTGNAVMNISYALEKCKLIEDTVREVDPGLYPWLLLGVTSEHATYNWLHTRKGMPCGAGMYHERRREVYFRLSERI